MWGIEHPVKVFDYIANLNSNILNVIIPEKKYLSFPKEDILKIEQEKKISITKILLKNPNNPAKTIPSIHISIKR
jgi:hypothetical protein